MQDARGDEAFDRPHTPACHKKAGVREAMERGGGRLLYLRTAEGVWRAIGWLIDRFGPVECRNYLRRVVYNATSS